MLALLGYVSLLFAALPSTAPGAKIIAAKLEARYRQAHVSQATFLERYFENGRVVRSEAGVVYFRRPGKMRWEYESPEKNLFLVDGKTAWFYVHADHTVTSAPAKKSTDWRTPLALLAGEMKLSRVCARIEPATREKPATPGNKVLHCLLRGEGKQAHSGQLSGASGQQSSGEDESVYLEVAPGTGDRARVLVRESGGVEVEFKFADWRFDLPIPASFFQFQVPAGVAIVNGEMPGEANP